MKAMNGHIITGTSICVDYWLWTPGKKYLHFLTHLHSDHTFGLKSSFRERIYTSPFNSWLLEKWFKIDPELIVPLTVGDTHVIYDVYTDNHFSITLIDANHCPGSVMFLFQGFFGNILYTGDFRFIPDMIEHPMLSSVIENEVVHKLYLDNTFAAEHCNIPSRKEALEKLITLISNHPDHFIVLGTRKLGKEEVLREVAFHFKEKILVSEARHEILRYLNYPNVFTTNKKYSRIMVKEIHEISRSFLHNLHLEKGPVLTIILTALYSFNTIDGGSVSEIPLKMSGVHHIPYSDHSSHSELLTFVSKVRPHKIYPIVLTKLKNVEEKSTESHYNNNLKKLSDSCIIPRSIWGLSRSSEACEHNCCKPAILSDVSKPVSSYVSKHPLEEDESNYSQIFKVNQIDHKQIQNSFNEPLNKTLVKPIRSRGTHYFQESESPSVITSIADTTSKPLSDDEYFTMSEEDLTQNVMDPSRNQKLQPDYSSASKSNRLDCDKIQDYTISDTMNNGNGQTSSFESDSQVNDKIQVSKMLPATHILHNEDDDFTRKSILQNVGNHLSTPESDSQVKDKIQDNIMSHAMHISCNRDDNLFFTPECVSEVSDQCIHNITHDLQNIDPPTPDSISQMSDQIENNTIKVQTCVLQNKSIYLSTSDYNNQIVDSLTPDETNAFHVEDFCTSTPYSNIQVIPNNQIQDTTIPATAHTSHMEVEYPSTPESNIQIIDEYKSSKTLATIHTLYDENERTFTSDSNSQVSDKIQGNRTLPRKFTANDEDDHSSEFRCNSELSALGNITPISINRNNVLPTCNSNFSDNESSVSSEILISHKNYKSSLNTSEINVIDEASSSKIDYEATYFRNLLSNLWEEKPPLHTQKSRISEKFSHLLATQYQSDSDSFIGELHVNNTQSTSSETISDLSLLKPLLTEPNKTSQASNCVQNNIDLDKKNNPTKFNITLDPFYKSLLTCNKHWCDSTELDNLHNQNQSRKSAEDHIDTWNCYNWEEIFKSRENIN